MSGFQPRGFINVLVAYGVPVTRDSYLETAYLGRVPEEIDAEIEAEGQAQLDEYYGRRGAFTEGDEEE